MASISAATMYMILRQSQTIFWGESSLPHAVMNTNKKLSSVQVCLEFDTIG